jgi:hypothetical protein
LKNSKISWILIFAGTFLVLAGIILGQSLVEKVSNIYGIYGINKITVSVKNLTGPGESFFTLYDIKRLKKEIGSSDIACSAVCNATVSYGNRSCNVRINGVNSSYNNFYNLNLKSGAIFTAGSEAKGDMVAIVDDELAFEMFGSVDVVGLNIKISGRTFSIIGVSSMDKSIIHNYYDDGIPNVYVPVSIMEVLGGSPGISYEQIQTNGTSPDVIDIDGVYNALASAGKDPSVYNVIDYNILKVSLSQKPLLIVFIAGMIIILLFLLIIKRSIKEIYWIINNEHGYDYFSNIIKKKYAEIVLGLLKIIACMVGIFILWKAVKFKVYIPPNYIPDDFTDISYFLNLFKSNLQDSILNLGYIPPYEELVIDKANILGNGLFFIGVFAGFLLLYLGVYQLKSCNIRLDKIVLYNSLCILLPVFTSTLAFFIFGMPCILSVKNIVIIWILIFSLTLTENSKVTCCDNL